jgi:hypothetical protein
MTGLLSSGIKGFAVAVMVGRGREAASTVNPTDIRRLPNRSAARQELDSSGAGSFYDRDPVAALYCTGGITPSSRVLAHRVSAPHAGIHAACAVCSGLSCPASSSRESRRVHARPLQSRSAAVSELSTSGR